MMCSRVLLIVNGKADYDQLVASELQRLQNLSSHATIDHEGEDSVEDVLPPGGEDIGSYHQAHHFKDGLFSTIFKARGKNAGIFALKVTHSSTMSAPHDVHREARLLLKAASENVVTLLETFELSGARFVLAFPFVPYDLQQLLSQRRLSEQQKKSCLRDLMKGLHHLHGLGIIHRDIKPSNILLKTPSGPALIADFGIAWCSGDPGSEPSDQKILDVGTTSYRPPELLFGNQSYNESLDMWAAGCVAAQVIELGNQTLFDAGDLGSELALIKSIFETLGTPNLGMWSVSLSETPMMSMQMLTLLFRRLLDSPIGGRCHSTSTPANPGQTSYRQLRLMLEISCGV